VDQVQTATTISKTAATAGATTATAPKPAGPEAAIAFLGQYPYGGSTVAVSWAPVTNATAYRIYGMPTATVPGVLRGTVSAADAAKAMGATHLMAVDLEPCVKYWVEAVFADGSTSEPGPIVDTKLYPSGSLTAGLWGPVAGVTATVSGTTTVTLVDGQQVRGNKVTWTWNTQPSDQAKAYVYWTTVQVQPPGSTTLGMPIYHTERIRIRDTAPFAILNDGGTPGPPFSMSFAAGSKVVFCVAQMPIADMVATGKLTYGWGTTISCTGNELPP
jgi:hypothetical protein